MKPAIWCLTAFLFLGCSKTLEIKDFNAMDWKNDKKGCEGKRAVQLIKLFEKRLELRGKSESEIISFLGHADQLELQTRSQKMFRYWISGGPGCSKNTAKKSLIIRFNAINHVSEVFME